MKEGRKEGMKEWMHEWMHEWMNAIYTLNDSAFTPDKEWQQPIIAVFIHLITAYVYVGLRCDDTHSSERNDIEPTKSKACLCSITNSGREASRRHSRDTHATHAGRPH
eukprot:GHVU01164550.1.p3 GENE.GHVU01164550.1~~GHVU01164550.1.p3  ORF type:complete len:108 (-),score=19.93 GHVU01164550.1:2381-2704(-)